MSVMRAVSTGAPAPVKRRPAAPTWKPAKLWLTGISSSVLMLTCGGRVATHQMVSADVLGGHRVHLRVERVGRRLVPAVAHQGEFGLDHAGLDRGDAHAVPWRSARRSSENWRTNALVPP